MRRKSENGVEMQQIQSYIPVDMVQRLDLFCQEFGMTRSKFIAYLIKFAIIDNDKYFLTATKMFQLKKTLETTSKLDQEKFDRFMHKCEELFEYAERQGIADGG